MKQKKTIKNLIKEIKKVPPQVERPYRERDMRNEAMDMGSHGAKEYFGGKDGAV